MKKEELNALTKKAIDHWMKEEHEEAEQYFSQAYPHIDPNHLYATNFYSEYAINQKRLGKTEEATKLYKEAVESALLTDTEQSIAVAVARFGLGEHYFLLADYEKALLAIKPSLDNECDKKELALYLYAQIHYKLGNESECVQTAEKLLSLLPKENNQTLDNILKRIRNES